MKSMFGLTDSIRDFVRVEKDLRRLLTKLGHIKAADKESKAQKFLLYQMIQFLVNETEIRLNMCLTNQNTEKQECLLYDVSLRFPLLQHLIYLLGGEISQTSTPVSVLANDS